MAPQFPYASPPCELESTLEHVVTHYARRLHQLLHLSPDDLADVRQDLYLAAWSALPAFDAARACLRTYVDRVLRHAASDILRNTLRTRYRMLRFDDFAATDDDLEWACDITGAIDMTDEAAPQTLAQSMVTETVDMRLTLDAFQRTLPLELLVVFRCLMTGGSVAAIARQLGIGESLVRYRIRKLRKAFLRFETPAVRDPDDVPPTRR